jgi:hypothetical protein
MDSSDINAENAENPETPPPSNENTKSKKINNWSEFGGSVLIALITVLLLGVLGANFVYLTRINIDYFFPTDPSQRPYTDKNKQGDLLPPLFNLKEIDGDIEMTGGRGGGCGTSIDISKSPLLKNKYFRGTFDYGSPYSAETPGNDTFGGVLGNWFSNKVKYSYIWLRTVEKAIVSFMSSLCAMSPESASDIVPFILGPLVIKVILLITSLWFLPAMVSVFWNENPNNPYGIWISIIGLFFGWTWFVPLMTTFVQIFSSMFKLILLPLMMNVGDIFEIMGRPFNAWWLKLIFFILVVVSAFKNLESYIAIPILIVFLFNALPPGVKIPGMDQVKIPGMDKGK